MAAIYWNYIWSSSLLVCAGVAGVGSSWNKGFFTSISLVLKRIKQNHLNNNNNDDIDDDNNNNDDNDDNNNDNDKKNTNNNNDNNKTIRITYRS